MREWAGRSMMWKEGRTLKRKRAEQARIMHALAQIQYQSAGREEQATYECSSPRLSVIQGSSPHQICGYAHRVGYLGTAPEDLALYRIKLTVPGNTQHSHNMVMLPGWFVLLNASFREVASLEEATGTEKKDE